MLILCRLGEVHQGLNLITAGMLLRQKLNTIGCKLIGRFPYRHFSLRADACFYPVRLHNATMSTLHVTPWFSGRQLQQSPHSPKLGCKIFLNFPKQFHSKAAHLKMSL
jgi:hypothetical protein